MHEGKGAVFFHSCEIKVRSSIPKPVAVMVQGDSRAKEMRRCGLGGPSHLPPVTEDVYNHSSAPGAPA